MSFLQSVRERLRRPDTQVMMKQDLWFEVQLYALKCGIEEDMAVRELIRRGLQRDVIERDDETGSPYRGEGCSVPECLGPSEYLIHDPTGWDHLERWVCGDHVDYLMGHSEGVIEG